MQKARIERIELGEAPMSECLRRICRGYVPSRGTRITLDNGMVAFAAAPVRPDGSVVVGIYRFSVGDEVVYSILAGQVASLAPVMPRVDPAILIDAINYARSAVN